ncbi:MAG: helix-turn-helix transcriptional regulator [Pseudomonadota bacterium]
MTGPGEPFVYRSGRGGDVQALISTLLPPFEVARARAPRSRSEVSNAPLASSAVVGIRHSDAVRVSGRLEGETVMAAAPLARSYRALGAKGGDVLVPVGRGLLLWPGEPYDFVLEEGACTLIVRTTTDRLRRPEAISVREDDGAARAAGAFDARTPGGAALLRLGRFLLTEADQNQRFFASHETRVGIEAALLDSLTLALDDAARGPAPGVPQDRPRQIVEEAEAYIAADLGRRVSIGDVAAHVGVSRRTLHRAFQALHGCTPMIWTREQRLLRAHAELRRGDPHKDKVIDIAGRWGFDNPGLFSGLYRARFGKRPSETLGKR